MKKQMAVMGSDGVKRHGTWTTLWEWNKEYPDGAPHQWLRCVVGADGVRRCGTCPTLLDWDKEYQEGAPHEWLTGYAAAAMPDDPVERPSHYTQGPVECIDGIRSALGPEGFRAFCRGNAIKYLWRAGLKGPEAEDLGKAEVYIRWAKQSAEGDR